MTRRAVVCCRKRYPTLPDDKTAGRGWGTRVVVGGVRTKAEALGYLDARSSEGCGALRKRLCRE